MMKLLLKRLVACTILLCIISFAPAQTATADIAAKEASYTKTITDRSNKIVAVLGITDSAKFYRVQNVLVQQYRNLNVIHDSANARIKAAKQTTEDKEAINAIVKKLDDERTAQLDKLHPVFLASLAKDLTEEQVVKLKDGMTYNVLPITYKAYQEMILTLTEEQKKQMYAWLVEAREKAIDAESADKKHAWFGKYKGRINNYLSAAGYDMKKEGEEWQKRIAAAKNKS